MSLSDFVLLSKIGEGSYSSVHKVKRVSDGNLYALKQVQTLSQSGQNGHLERQRKIKFT